MSNMVIQVDNISKYYRLGVIGTGTLAHDLNRWWAMIRGKSDPTLRVDQLHAAGGNSYDDYIWALKDISFEVTQGEILGIIGRNGAGKSTLLKILSRVTAPTTGECRIKGRIASLLEVGTGFHPELTGRENIFLNGAILGMTKEEIRRKFDEIVAFSEVEKYIDTPVKRYSSGMYVRLAFAVAAHLEPEILIIDEVLAVGDAEFQRKCLGKMGDVAKQGRTILFVSHNMNAIEKICDEGILFENGSIKRKASIKDVIRYYLDEESSYDLCPLWRRETESLKEPFKNSFLSPLTLALVDSEMNQLQYYINRDDDVHVMLEINLLQNVSDLTLGFSIFDENENLLFRSLHSDNSHDFSPRLKNGFNSISCRLPLEILNEGRYRIVLDASIYKKAWIFNPFKDRPPFITFELVGVPGKSEYWQDKRAGILAPLLVWENND